jgi:hypothetical protein
MTKKITLSESLVSLMEDEMDRAELVLAAKAILDKLQNMAEDIAKIEADDVLPLLDGIRSQFGPQFAEQLNNAATDSLRQALEAVKTSKDQIGQAIQNMQGIVTGTGSNDMATNTGTDAEMAPEAPVAPTADAGVGEVPAEGGDQGADDLAGEIDSLLGGEEENADQGPEGRTKKESAEFSGFVLSEQALELIESENPDEVLAKATMKLVRESKLSAAVAAKQVAEAYGVDVEDVGIAMRDFIEAMKLDKLLGENTKQWAKTVLTHKLAMKEGKNIGAAEAYVTADRVNAANAFASGKITESQCVKLAKI